MSRKTASDSGNGFADVIGSALLLVAALLLASQLSFDRNDLAVLHTPPNPSGANWIGPFGAHLAYATFFIFGLAAYVLPIFAGGVWRRLHFQISFPPARAPALVRLVVGRP